MCVCVCVCVCVYETTFSQRPANVCVCVCVCVCDSERERVCVCVWEGGVTIVKINLTVPPCESSYVSTLQYFEVKSTCSCLNGCGDMHEQSPQKRIDIALEVRDAESTE